MSTKENVHEHMLLETQMRTNKEKNRIPRLTMCLAEDFTPFGSRLHVWPMTSCSLVSTLACWPMNSLGVVEIIPWPASYGEDWSRSVLVQVLDKDLSQPG